MQIEDFEQLTELGRLVFASNDPIVRAATQAEFVSGPCYVEAGRYLSMAFNPELHNPVIEAMAFIAAVVKEHPSTEWAWELISACLSFAMLVAKDYSKSTNIVVMRQTSGEFLLLFHGADEPDTSPEIIRIKQTEVVPVHRSDMVH